MFVREMSTIVSATPVNCYYILNYPSSMRKISVYFNRSSQDYLPRNPFCLVRRGNRTVQSFQHKG